MFKVGDKVAYPMHGAAIIKGVEKETEQGEEQQYFVLEPCLGHLKIKVPVSMIEKLGIRPIISENEADKVINDFISCEYAEESNWNKRYRDNLETLKSGNLAEIAKITKTLMLRDKKKSLSNAERKMLNNAKSILISELIMSKNLTYDDIETMLISKIS